MVTAVDEYKAAKDLYDKLSKIQVKEKVMKTIRDTFKDLTLEEIDEICVPGVPKSEITDIFLGFDDWGSKFIVQDNRDIKMNYVELYKNEPGILNSMFHLLKVGKNKYRILDGQHRILALIQKAGETGTKFKIRCTVYPISHFENELEICELIQKINVSNKQTKGDMLKIFSSQSPWIKIAVKLDIETMFSFSAARNAITWPNIIESYIIYKHVVKQKKFSRVSLTAALRKEIWLNEDPVEINKYLSFLNWYYPFSITGTKDLGLSGFSATDIIAIVAAIYFENILYFDMDIYMSRMLKYPQLDQIAYQKSMDDLAKFILNTMNYRVTSRLISLFGENGR